MDSDGDVQISISIDMDIRNENAVFLVEMPTFWQTKLFKTNDINTNLALQNYQNMKDPSDSEQLNVEITMLLHKENLTKSKILANITSKEANVKTVVNGNVTIPKIIYDSDSIADNLRTEFKSVDRENLTKRYDFRYKLPEIKIPSKRKSANSPPNSLNSESSPQARYDFRYKLRRVELPCMESQQASSNPGIDIEGDLSNDELKTNGSSNTFSFNVLPAFIKRRLSRKSNSEIDDRPEPSNHELSHDNHPNRFDFRYKLPVIELPCLPVTKISANNDNDDSNLCDTESQLNSKTTEKTFQLPTFELPKIELPTLFSRERSGNEEIDKDNGINETTAKRFDFRYQLPTIAVPFLSNKEKAQNPDMDVDPNTNGDSRKESFDSVTKEESATARFDFRYKLPSIELPKIEFPSFQAKELSPEDDTTVTPVNRFDFRYQLPTIEVRSPFRNGDSQNQYVERDPNTNGDSRKESFDSVTKEESATARFDFRYKLPSIELPKIEFPLFQAKESSPEAAVSISPVNRYDFRYQLPRIDLSELNLPKFELPNLLKREDSAKLDSNSDSSNHKSLDHDLNIEDHSRRHDFRYQLPIFSSNDQTHNTDENQNDFCRNFQPIKSHMPDNYIHPSDCIPRDSKFHTSPTYTIFDIRRKLSDLRKSHPNGPRSHVPLLEQDQIDRQESLDFFFPDTKYKESSRRPLFDEHSDIDLYPSPFKSVSLPHFNPLSSVYYGSAADPSGSDVGSIRSYSPRYPQSKASANTNGLSRRTSANTNSPHASKNFNNRS